MGAESIRARPVTRRPDAPRSAARLHFLVLRCQAGDERALAYLVDWFADRTLWYLEGLVGPDAEDVQQEVWLSVYRGIRVLQDPRAFHTWLFRTARYHAIDRLRRRKRQQRLLQLTAGEAVEAEGLDHAKRRLREFLR